MFLFLISNCLTVIEVLVNFGIEPGPACWEVCHCEGWSKSWCTDAIIFFLQHKRMNWFLAFNIVKLLTFVEMVMKCYWTVNFILTGAKRRSIWIVYCSIALHLLWNKCQQLFYSINVWKDCRLEVITQNFGSRLTWSQTRKDRFSHDEAHLSIRFDICSIIIQLKVDRKHTLIHFLY